MTAYNIIIISTNSIFLILYSPDIDDCDPNPCLHDGECIDGADSYTCACAAGYTGTDCEIGKWTFPLLKIIHFCTKELWIYALSIIS